MQYTQEFKDRARKHINSKQFNNHLENGDECVGRYLFDSFQGEEISPEELVKAIDSNDVDKLNKLYNQAKKIVELKSLYHEWESFYDAEKQY